MIRLPPLRPASAAPLRAWLFDSLPPLVKMISSALQPSSSAIWRRAASTALRASAPYQWELEGLPKWS